VGRVVVEVVGEREDFVVARLCEMAVADPVSCDRPAYR
jgi:hypothetical protein